MIFRWPGGKAKYVEAILSFLVPIIKTEFHDVFVGGGSILCAVAKKYSRIRLFANDLDPYLYAFWNMIAEGDRAEIGQFLQLCNQVPTVKLFKELRLSSPKKRFEMAHYALFFNRTTFSGIHNAGPIGGYQQSSQWSVGCRYNVKEIVKRTFEMVDLFHDRLTVTNDDGCKYVERLTDAPALYLDPPYYEKGKSLYRHYMTHDEHVKLSSLLKHRRNWLLSIDICKPVEEMYDWADKCFFDVAYSIIGKKVNWRQRKEYLILSKGFGDVLEKLGKAGTQVH